MAEQIHAFEDRGLGKAPFVFVGLYSLPSKSLAEQNPSAYNAALADMPRGYGVGSCAFCGMALTHNFMIRSSDGRKFVVGCDCVAKTDDSGLIKKISDAEKARRRELREAAWRRRRDKRENALAAKRLEEAEQERLENGGLTLTEIGALRQRESARLLTPIAKWLNDDRGGFRQSVARDMEMYGTPPRGKALRIVLDIIGMQAGRGGSKQYNLMVEQTERVIEAAEAIYATSNAELVREFGGKDG